MATFNLEKGSHFDLDKGVKRVKIGLGWSISENAGKNFDPDACAFGLVHLPGGAAKFYNDASHAVFYGNTPLKVKSTGAIVSKDGSIKHTGDNREGGIGDCEVIEVDFDLLPKEIVEISIWVSIFKAIERKQNFGAMKNSYIKITDMDANLILAEYKLRDEFPTALSVQVGSFMKDERTESWSFVAVGAGAEVELKAVLDRYN